MMSAKTRQLQSVNCIVGHGEEPPDQLLACNVAAQSTRLKVRYACTREARRAHPRVAHALGTGEMVKPDHCERCGVKRFVEQAYFDYSRPLDVFWLCRTCHRKWDHFRPKGGAVVLGEGF